MREPLTEAEENLLKDLIKELDHHSASIKRVAHEMQVTPAEIDSRLGIIWNKLNNGRLTVQQG